MAIRSLFIVLSLSLIVCVAAVDHPIFEEGDANTTINIGAVLSEDKTLRCTVKDDDSESELKELNMLPPSLSPEDNWEVDVNETEGWAEVTITKVTKKNKDKTFTCEAKNANEQHSFLTYDITTIYEGTTFDEGEVNSTIPMGLTLGTTAEIRCTIKSADPAITELTIEPEPFNDPNLEVIGEDKKWIGIRFKQITDTTALQYVCTARSDVTVAKLTYNISLFDGIAFDEGSTNGTLNRTLITETTDEFTCTVKSSDPPINDLFIEPTPPPGDKDYEVIKNDTSVTVKFLKISDKTPLSFKCTAKNNMTAATLEYQLTVSDPKAPLFTMGGNDTIWNEIATGSNHTLYCTVLKGTALPEVTMVVANPPTDKNWEVIKKDDFSVEIQITKADSSLNKMDYECYATNGLRSTNLTYQNYVGGPPSALEVKVDSVVKKNNMEFSLTVTDRNTAPARNILVFIAGVTDKNVTLRVPTPDNYDNEIQYAFPSFLTKSVSAIRENPQMMIYANNTLGDAFIKEIGIAVPQIESSKTNSGAIAAGVLVPLFVVLGAVIIGAVVYYFWRKGNRGKNVSFSKINNDNIEDAQGSSTYGAL